MLNPIVIPLPLAGVAVIVLALVGLATNRLFDLSGLDAPAKPAGGRHRATPAWQADPNRRDWAAIAAERMHEAGQRTMQIPVLGPGENVHVDLAVQHGWKLDPLDLRVPISEVERARRSAATLGEKTCELEPVA